MEPKNSEHVADPIRALLAGLVATIAMTAVLSLLSAMSYPLLDMAALLGSIVNYGGIPAVFTSAWWLGMLVHLLLGIVFFPFMYAYFAYGGLSGRPWVRGAGLGLVLWATMQIVLMPLMGKGLFAVNLPESFLFTSGMLIAHLIYGSVLGALAGEQETHKSYVASRQFRSS